MHGPARGTQPRESGMQAPGSGPGPTAASTAPGICQCHCASLQRRASLGALTTIAVELLAAYTIIVYLIPCYIGWPASLTAYLVAEAAFLCLWLRKRRALNAIPERHEPDSHDGMAFFQKWHASSHYNSELLAIADLLQHWFKGVPMSEIRRGNAAELVARGYFYKRLDELEAEGKAHLVEEMLLAIEGVWGVRFDDGLNPNLSYMHHLQEPLKATYRPLGFYLVCEAMAAVKHAALLAAGFQCHTYHAYTYYTYNLPSEEQAAPGCGASHADLHPVVFLHGVGVGLLPYIPFLLRTTALGRPVLAMEYKHLSMRWTDFIPTAPQVAADMSHIIFDLHGIRKASLLAHSYGTFYVSCLLKAVPDKIHAVGLIDPVTCCMWSGHLINSFVYLHGVLDEGVTGMITWLIARDLHIAAGVSRNFFWTECNLWPCEVPKHTVVALSGRDALVPVKHVEAMLRHETDATVLLQQDFRHADFLFSSSWQDNILSHFAELMHRASQGSSRAAQNYADVCSSATAAAAAAAGASLSPSKSSISSLESEPDTTIMISLAAGLKHPSKPQLQLLPDTAGRPDDAQEPDQGLVASDRQQQQRGNAVSSALWKLRGRAAQQ